MGQTVIELIENSEGRQELWQWDLGRKVKIIPAEGITVDEVHFGNVFSGEALVVEPKVDETTGDIVADVPNILTTQFFRINVYAVMIIPDGKVTTERVMLDVEAREKPSDYVYTETEIKNYDALEERIKALEENGGSGGNGKPGADGFSPIASVEQTADGAEITIIDKNGTTKATVKNGKNGKDGYTPQKGIDYFDGKDGKDGADGKDGLNGKDGASGKTAYQYAQDGGYTGTEEEFAEKLAEEYPTREEVDKLSEEKADKENTYTKTEVDEMLQNLPSGSGGDAIIDVVALPTEDIKEDSFYRLLTGKLVINQVLQNMYTCYCVETLPEVGEPATNIEQTEGNVYYNLSDGELYGYVDEMLSMGLGVPVGWYTASILLGALGFGYNGVITDIMDDPRDEAFRFLLEYELYSYKEGKWTSHKAIGKAGTGASAEVFNHPSNEATGECSHAEGYGTEAKGDYSHAEGHNSHAEGLSSHAEGYASHAEGSNSHAEGYNSHAEGYNSHAEGLSSHAEGYASHAEGENTIASAEASHAQGKYNIGDTEKKYAHIVGNGASDTKRSNAHTLDWQGNAEFQGDVVARGCGGENPISLIGLSEIFADFKSRFDAIVDGSEVAW